MSFCKSINKIRHASYISRSYSIAIMGRSKEVIIRHSFTNNYDSIFTGNCRNQFLLFSSSFYSYSNIFELQLLLYSSKLSKVSYFCFVFGIKINFVKFQEQILLYLGFLVCDLQFNPIPVNSTTLWNSSRGKFCIHSFNSFVNVLLL